MANKKLDIEAIHRVLKVEKTALELENLLKSGLNPDTLITNGRYSDLQGKTLLQIACHDNDIPKIETLVQYGCHVNYSVKDSLDKGHLLTLLDTNVKDLTKTCLYQAICSSNAKIVEILVKSGADAGIKCQDKMTALMHAVDSQNLEIVRVILKAKHCDINAQDNFGLSALHMAAIHGREDILEVLLQNRARVDILQCQGGTPLFLASTPEATRVLLRYGTDPDRTTRDDVTAMNCLMKKSRDVECVTHLLDAGVKISKSYLDDLMQNTPKILQKNPGILDRIQRHANAPISLKLQTTHVIRRSVQLASHGIGSEFNRKINFLPLPKLLIKFVRDFGLDDNVYCS